PQHSGLRRCASSSEWSGSVTISTRRVRGGSTTPTHRNRPDRNRCCCRFSMRSRTQRRTRSAARQSPSPSATIWSESPGHSYSSAAGCICAHHADEILVYVGNGKNSYWATVAHIDVQDGVLTVDGETRYSRFGSERMPGLDSSGT